MDSNNGFIESNLRGSSYSELDNQFYDSIENEDNNFINNIIIEEQEMSKESDFSKCKTDRF